MHGHIDRARVLTLTVTSAFLRKWNAFDSPVSARLTLEFYLNRYETLRIGCIQRTQKLAGEL